MYKDSIGSNMVLRTDKGPQYTVKSFRDTIKLENIKHEYIIKIGT